MVVGVAVGEIVGLSDVGVAVGETDGLAVGLDVGLTVVGVVVGEAVGVAVGLSVGLNVPIVIFTALEAESEVPSFTLKVK